MILYKNSTDLRIKGIKLTSSNEQHTEPKNNITLILEKTDDITKIRCWRTECLIVTDTVEIRTVELKIRKEEHFLYITEQKNIPQGYSFIDATFSPENIYLLAESFKDDSKFFKPDFYKKNMLFVFKRRKGLDQLTEASAAFSIREIKLRVSLSSRIVNLPQNIDKDDEICIFEVNNVASKITITHQKLKILDKEKYLGENYQLVFGNFSIEFKEVFKDKKEEPVEPKKKENNEKKFWFYFGILSLISLIYCWYLKKKRENENNGEEFLATGNEKYDRDLSYQSLDTLSRSEEREDENGEGDKEKLKVG